MLRKVNGNQALALSFLDVRNQVETSHTCPRAYTYPSQNINKHTQKVASFIYESLQYTVRTQGVNVVFLKSRPTFTQTPWSPPHPGMAVLFPCVTCTSEASPTVLSATPQSRGFSSHKTGFYSSSRLMKTKQANNAHNE